MNQTPSLTKVLVACASIVIILAGVKSAGDIIIPFLLALFISVICSPIIKFMTKRRVPLALAIGILFSLILMLFLFLAGMINSSIAEFTASIPQYKTQLADKLALVSELTQRWKLPIKIAPNQLLNQFDPSTVMNLVSHVLLSFSGVVSNVFILLLVVLFMLFEIPTAKYKLALAMSSDDDLSDEEHYLDSVLAGVIGYLGVKTVMGMVTAGLIGLLLWSFDVQYAVLWAVLAFLFNYVPNIGATLACLPIVLQVFLFKDPSIALLITALLIAINVVTGSVIEPKIMGKRLGLSTLVVFLSLLFWGWLLGTVGMLLSVPLTMAFKIALELSPATKRYAVLLGDIAQNIAKK